ncbi:MAG TPA: hypothetical protein PLB41_01395 [Rubrivivax sp.]|nr:hypothetical protein [Rubrivivax sp.]HPO19549.1 hypothetical protein [Rubrivivax sp.]
MPKTEPSRATGSGKGTVAAAGEVRRLKGRLAKPAQPVTLDEMRRAVAEQRARIGRS